MKKGSNHLALKASRHAVPSWSRRQVSLSVPRLIAAIVAVIAFAQAHATEPATARSSIKFVEAASEFPTSLKNLRKWDAPLVADLDQDGSPDLLLNDHGYGVRVLWNSRGRFGEPYDLVTGDMHGLAVGDIDRDGLLEIVISRGGGSGSNARNAKVFRIGRDRTVTEDRPLAEPLARMRGRTIKLCDGDNDGDLDLLNFAFPSKEKEGDSENYVYRNDGLGHFELAGRIPPVKRDGQKTLLTDFDSDGVFDLILYGHGRLTAFRGMGDLNFKRVSDSVFPGPIVDVTCAVEFDYDNDGDFDLYLARGKDLGAGDAFFNAEKGLLGFYAARGLVALDDFPASDVLHIDNLQSQWPTKTLFVGESAYEHEFPGETHSGRDVRLVNSDALGWPDETTEKGAYIGYVGNGRWRLHVNTWSPTTGVLRGVTDYAPKESSEGLRDVLLRNDGGAYVDVTEALNLGLTEHTTGATSADIDNDGFQDLIVIRRGDLVNANRAIVYRNRSGASFDAVLDSGIVSPEPGAIGLGVEASDLDGDGHIEVILGPERGKWRLFTNKTSAEAERSLTVEVGRAPSGRGGPLGAIVRVEAGPLKQVRRLGSTPAAYSLGKPTTVLFGLGDHRGETKVEVRWTNGETQHRVVSAGERRVRLGEARAARPNRGEAP